MAENMKKAGIYFHWPYCKSKCPYCDFYKEIAKNIPQEEAIDSYIADLDFYYSFIGDEKIVSVFFGGGSPSLIKPELVEKLLNRITKKFSIAENPEISLEANPNTDRPNLFADLKNAGINRLSLGVQALNENDLKFLGRTHTLQEARESLQEIIKIFDNHSADLIYARPQQTKSEWQQELAEICGYGLKHLSLYQLTIEENTVFARKNIEALNDEAAADLYTYTREYLAGKGYNLYEVSNFAQTGYESRHNLTYWQGGDYIGIGKSAQGRLTENGTFFAVDYPFINEAISTAERAEELIITGLRLTKGINKKTFQTIIGSPLGDYINILHLKELKKMGLLTENPEYLSATPQGLLVLNTIIAQLCL